MEEGRDEFYQVIYERVYFDEEKISFEDIALVLKLKCKDTVRHHVRKLNQHVFEYMKKMGKMSSSYIKLIAEYTRHEFKIE